MYKDIPEIVPTRSCTECCQRNNEKYHQTQLQKYKHIWTRADGSTITDPYEIVDDQQLHE